MLHWFTFKHDKQNHKSGKCCNLYIVKAYDEELFKSIHTQKCARASTKEKKISAINTIKNYIFSINRLGL